MTVGKHATEEKRRIAEAGDVDERWVPVAGFDGYEVSDQGRVRSLDKMVRTYGNRRPFVRHGRILKQQLGTHGYMQVGLTRDGEKSQHRVHRLVCEAFHGPCPDGMETLHGPAGRLDNRAINLQWGTSKQNRQDAHRDGTFVGFGIEAENPSAKLTPEIVHECRTRHAQGESQTALADEFDVNHSVMARMLRGETWVDPGYRPRVEHANARLTNDDVRAIRSSPLPASVLASQYEVHPQTIRRIKCGDRRKNVA